MTRALVLGGGGPVGIGWESGLIDGFADAGIDLRSADAIIGTSAGSFVGAQLASGLRLRDTVDQLHEARAVMSEPTTEGDSVADRMQALMAVLTRAATSEGPPEEARKEIGRLALESAGIGEEEFVGFFSVLAGREWPERFACTAVDASSGEFVVWRAGSAADLQHGVASSCSVPCVYSPVTIAGRRYIDGGMRDGLNVDVAAGHDQVVAISCMILALPEGMSDPIFDALVGRVAVEIDALRSAGSHVEVVTPSDEFLELSGWGTALMDPGKAQAAYECGLRHAASEASRISDLWSS